MSRYARNILDIAGAKNARGRPRGLVTAVGTAALSLGYWALLSPRSQLLGSFPYRGAGGEKVVALTFDDGPNEPYTSQIGDFLAGQGIAGTFFQVGACAERWPAAGPRLLAQGHVIGNHSFSHDIRRCLRPAPQRRETLRAQGVLSAAIGHRPGLYRPPWLLRTRYLLRMLGTHGLQPVSGTFCHPLEVFQPPAERIARHALAKVRPGTILIFHDGFDARGGDRTQTVAAVRLVVAALQRQGYGFSTVDELLSVPAYQADPAS